MGDQAFRTRRRRVTRRHGTELGNTTPFAAEPDSVTPGSNQPQQAGPTPLMLADLRSPQFADALGTLELVLIPVGAHEQHGPALPVSTDTLSAQVLSGLAGALLGPRVGIAPAIPFGVSWHHLGFPGTISLSEATLGAVIEDVVTSLHGYGIDRFVFVNTHGGNNAALEVAAERIHREHRVPLVVSLYAYSYIADAARSIIGDAAIGHGGGDESAVVLATRPDLVDRSSLGVREAKEPVREVMRMVRSGGGVLPIAQDRTSVSGASGDSSDATPEAGTAILASAAAQLQAVVEALLELDLDDISKSMTSSANESKEDAVSGTY